MIYVIYVFAALFLTLASAMIYVFYRERHFGILLMGATYAVSGLLAIVLSHWWPLVAGFFLAWMLSFLGMEEGAGPPPAAREEGTQAEGSGTKPQTGEETRR